MADSIWLIIWLIGLAWGAMPPDEAVVEAGVEPI